MKITLLSIAFLLCVQPTQQIYAADVAHRGKCNIVAAKKTMTKMKAKGSWPKRGVIKINGCKITVRPRR
jgi:hypothetical protein